MVIGEEILKYSRQHSINAFLCDIFFYPVFTSKQAEATAVQAHHMGGPID